MEIVIREMKTIAELEQMQAVEEAVWQDAATPIHQTLTVFHNGGVLIGAFLGEKMIGFQYSFAGFDGKEAYLVSHSLGILPEYRKSGLGEKIKLKQAEVAAEKGYSKMIWTFDPLESVNAYLNLHKLGGSAVSYKENHYGTMEDGLNKGLATDRFLVEWDFQEPIASLANSFDTSRLLLEMDLERNPKRTTVSFDGDGDVWFVAIPENMQKIKVESLDLASEWRMCTREVFQLLFSNGYQAKDVIRGENVSYYGFVKR
ncbi:GNAT family N-acetyltransferase [Ornithinibacillus californiensis]|uniref:GNAT family N-acetyltransferase n=1 Tax=Ornithinibacillus californiensis TaxID=161536 RepID=UPI00069CFAA6|nr:GNAT family N-acetyltransferase [Ornithinibacillus californiensis]